MITNDNIVYSNESNGFISVTNSGAFVAKCSLGYKYKGQSYFKSVNYLSVLQSHLFIIPQGATEIVLEIDCWIDFSLSTTMCIKHFKNVVQKCFYLWGTVVYNGCAETRCSSNDGGNGDNGGNPTPPPTPTPPCCCCCCCCCKC